MMIFFPIISSNTLLHVCCAILKTAISLVIITSCFYYLNPIILLSMLLEYRLKNTIGYFCRDFGKKYSGFSISHSHKPEL